ncbi:MAG: hypothetical protein HWD61_06405 [Parachlamydiaceae bacterium]|nr:MAG: hypothetical protein HWD61_06405 [Parachlamydiaceae bacterium]
MKRDQEFTHSQSFVSCLDCQKLEAIHAKKITDVWEGQLNNPRYYPYQLDAYTKFLVGLRYFEHEIDERYAWKPEWKSDLTRNEILVIERSDKTLRFCKVSSRINEGYRFLVGYQYQEHSYKHRGKNIFRKRQKNAGKIL